MKSFALLLIPYLVISIPACSSDDGTGTEVQTARSAMSTTWVAIEPIQCLKNPWEQDWLEKNDWDYDSYPKDPARPGLEPAEFEVIQDFYDAAGVAVSEGQTAPKYDSVCLACTCPEGHTMYLLVRDQDVDTMLGLGYRVESPPQE